MLLMTEERAVLQQALERPLQFAGALAGAAQLPFRYRHVCFASVSVSNSQHVPLWTDWCASPFSPTQTRTLKYLDEYSTWLRCAHAVDQRMNVLLVLEAGFWCAAPTTRADSYAYE